MININKYTLKPEAIKQAIYIHKQCQCDIGNNHYDEKTIHILDTISKDIALVKSQFQCAKCKSNEKRLTFHHLILTCYKEYMTINQYHMIRMNYKNILVLCKDCHKSFHGKNAKAEDLIYISEERTEGIIRDYYEKR